MIHHMKIVIVFVLLSFNHLTHANSISLTQGSGSFTVDGGEGKEDLTLSVHYNFPKNFTPNSPILMVLSGSGRTADKYKDRWIQASEECSVLVLAISYPKKGYPKSANYNLARMVKKEDGQFKVVKKASDWTFSDLNRIFDLVVAQTGSHQKNYDFFGHSAGGQFGHRFALFSPDSKANRILSANSGWYTTTDFDTPFPYGLADGPFSKAEMKQILQRSLLKKLVVFLGEKDDRNETKGSLRRDHQADKQGLSRIERGEYFYNKAKEYAQKNSHVFNWEIHIVKDVGHSSTKMSQAAANYLYSEK